MGIAEFFKNPKQLGRKISNRIGMLKAAGAPPRYLLKAFQWLSSPRERAVRSALANGLAKDVDPQQLVLLRRDGFLRIEGLELLSELNAAMQAKMGQAPGRGTGKQLYARSFFSTLLSEEDCVSDSIFTRFGLQPKVLNMVSAYMGTIPILEGIEGLVSYPHDKPVWEESQLWHRDCVDTRNLKLFVYFTDVLQENDGPFTFIAAPFSTKVKNKWVPRRITDEEMEKQGFAQNAQYVYGKKLSAFLIDTARCYHRGSRCKESNRVAFVTSFVTHAALKLLKSNVRLRPPASDLLRLIIRN